MDPKVQLNVYSRQPGEWFLFTGHSTNYLTVTRTHQYEPELSIIFTDFSHCFSFHTFQLLTLIKAMNEISYNQINDFEISVVDVKKRELIQRNK